MVKARRTRAFGGPDCSVNFTINSTCDVTPKELFIKITSHTFSAWFITSCSYKEITFLFRFLLYHRNSVGSNIRLRQRHSILATTMYPNCPQHARWTGYSGPGPIILPGVQHLKAYTLQAWVETVGHGHCILCGFHCLSEEALVLDLLSSLPYGK